MTAIEITTEELARMWSTADRIEDVRRAPAPDRDLGRRFFTRLSDLELATWRPTGGYNGRNISEANREMRRRAQRAGLHSPYEWLTQVVRPRPTMRFRRGRNGPLLDEEA